MLQICSRHAPDMLQICSRHAPDMLQICSRYAPDMLQTCYRVCKFAPYVHIHSVKSVKLVIYYTNYKNHNKKEYKGILKNKRIKE